MYLLFAKKASAFNSWFENAEEDLTDPVRCNSVEEIMVKLSISVLEFYIQSNIRKTFSFASLHHYNNHTTALVAKKHN